MVVPGGYKIYRTTMMAKPYTYETTFGSLTNNTVDTYSRLSYGMWISRPDFGLYFKMFQGLYVAVAVAMLVFFIKPTDVDPRFGLGVGALFAVIANTYVASGVLPDTGVMTLTDKVNFVSMIMVMLTVIQSTISLYIYDIRGEQALSKLFDKVSLVILTITYVFINIAIPWVASS